MNLIQLSIRQPVSTFSVVILVVLFGLIGLSRLPVQLTPDVEVPTITITTSWFGASPYEIEKEIVERQEEVLKSIMGLKKLESSSFNNFAEIRLSFKVGADLEATMTRVANKLNEVKRYPDNADRPVISGTGGDSAPIIWMMLKMRKGDLEQIVNYRSFFENEVRHTLERVPGVGSLFVFGGTEQRLEIVVDPLALATRELTISNVIERISSANSNVSAGVLGVGKRNYRVRTVSEFQSINEPGEVVLKDDGVHRVYLADVATTQLGYYPNAAPNIHNNVPMIVVAIRKEAGANVLELTERAHKAVKELNEGLLKENGIYLDWVHDQTHYINTAISTVKTNLLLGGVLAIGVLLLFLRSISATITVAIAIPISVIGTFLFMYFFGRNINVVSLAGISFAVGMLVDNAIVVLENIDRHRHMGKAAIQASYDGAREVWGAVLASTVTTVAVFLPIIFIEEEAGQLFRDIAIAISFSIMLSLLVSISVIPAMTRLFYGLSNKVKVSKPPGEGNPAVKFLMLCSRLTLKNTITRLVTVAIFVTGSVLLVQNLLPKAEYLPQGNRNLIMNILIPPPGYSDDKRAEMGRYIMDELKPYLEEDYKDGVPQIENLFYVGSERFTIFGGTSKHVTEARDMMPVFSQVMNSIPGVFGVSIQRGIFESGIGKGRGIDVNISGEDYNTIVGAARVLYGALSQAIPGSQIRPVPSLEIGYPEVNFIPDRASVQANGLSEQALGIYIDVLMDGRKIGEYKPEGSKLMDMVLTSSTGKIKAPEDLLNGLIATPYGELVRIGDLLEIEYTQGMTQVDHLERKRNIRLEVTPPEDHALQQALETINEELLPKLQATGQLAGVEVHVGGNADKLTETRLALQWNFLLAIVITYLLLAALFSNYLYPLVILFSVPMAAAGGFIGLALVNRFVAPQPFDILVMLGFIILVGTVVNNAILIVHQTLNNVRYESMQSVDAILHSVRTRIRPIFMSAATSLFGLLPLVLSTGSGSELYRGLGSVILGGLALSTVLTLFVVPALLSFLIGHEKPRDKNSDIAG
ncbi:MAG: efflux RND transporter permease subunit [Candidatus Polarisedimenticolaceae bacterium]|nr:efflux RND transporter permease subunit [Candidatus Polarisedimenticolaceae bacterium]